MSSAFCNFMLLLHISKELMYFLLHYIVVGYIADEHFTDETYDDLIKYDALLQTRSATTYILLEINISVIISQLNTILYTIILHSA